MRLDTSGTIVIGLPDYTVGFCSSRPAPVRPMPPLGRGMTYWRGQTGRAVFVGIYVTQVLLRKDLWRIDLVHHQNLRILRKRDPKFLAQWSIWNGKFSTGGTRVVDTAYMEGIEHRKDHDEEETLSTRSACCGLPMGRWLRWSFKRSAESLRCQTFRDSLSGGWRHRT